MPTAVGTPEMTDLIHFTTSVQNVVDDFMQAVITEYIDHNRERRKQHIAKAAIAEFEHACTRAEHILSTCNAEVTADLRAVYAEAKDAFYLASVTYNRALIRFARRKEQYLKCSPLTRGFMSPRAVRNWDPWRDDEGSTDSELVGLSFVVIVFGVFGLFMMGSLLAGLGVGGNGDSSGLSVQMGTETLVVWGERLKEFREEMGEFTVGVGIFMTEIEKELRKDMLERFAEAKKEVQRGRVGRLSFLMAGCAREKFPGIEKLFVSKDGFARGIYGEEGRFGDGVESGNGSCMPREAQRWEKRVGLDMIETSMQPVCELKETACERMWFEGVEMFEEASRRKRRIGTGREMMTLVGSGLGNVVNGILWPLDHGEMEMKRWLRQKGEQVSKFFKPFVEFEVKVGLHWGSEREITRGFKLYAVDVEQVRGAWERVERWRGWEVLRNVWERV